MALITEDLEIPPIQELFPTTKRWKVVKPCPSTAAARRHYRHGEKRCDPCAEVELQRHRDYDARRSDGPTVRAGRVDRVA